MARQVETLRLAALKRTFAYATAPDGGRPDDPLPRRVGAMVRALAMLDQKLAEGREIEGEHASLQISLAQARAELKAARVALVKAEQQVFLPAPANDPAMDAELRGWVRSLTSERQQAVMQEIGQGQHRGVLEAFARLPVPDPLAESARAVYRSFVEKSNPKAVAEIERRRAEISWTESATEAVRGVIDDATAAQLLPPSILVDESE